MLEVFGMGMTLETVAAAMWEKLETLKTGTFETSSVGAFKTLGRSMSGTLKAFGTTLRTFDMLGTFETWAFETLERFGTLRTFETLGMLETWALETLETFGTSRMFETLGMFETWVFETLGTFKTLEP